MPLNIKPGLLINGADFQSIPNLRVAIGVYSSYIIGSALSGKDVGLTPQQIAFIIQIGIDPAKKEDWIDRLVLWVGAEHQDVWPGKSVMQVTQELDSRMSGEKDADNQLL